MTAQQRLVIRAARDKQARRIMHLDQKQKRGRRLDYERLIAPRRTHACPGTS